MVQHMKTWIVFLFMSLAVPSIALAQDGQDPPTTDEADVDSLIDDAISDTPDDTKTDDGKTEDSKADATKADEKTAADADKKDDKKDDKKKDEPYVDDAYKTLDPNDPLYWSTMRDVYTLQQRRFQKDGRFGITVYAGLIPNNIFESYVPFGVRINYFILENLGLELAGSYALRVDKGLKDVIQEESGTGAAQVLIGDEQLSHTNFGIVWSPFNGKTAFYSKALNYFDLYLFAGAGVVVKQTQIDFNSEKSVSVKPEGALGGGLAFYLGTSSLVRLDFRQFVFEKIIGGVANPSEVSLGFGYFF